MDNFQKDIDDRANLTLSNRFELLLFRLGTSLNENKSELFGINVFKLREIVPMPTFTKPAGMKSPLPVFSASIEPQPSPADKVSPTVGTSTNTMSPNWLCAKSVMPIKASPPSTRHHSWSLEYFRFAGTFIIFGI